MKIGLYGIGLDTYWPQFKGLYERLTGYQARLAIGFEACTQASKRSIPALSTARSARAKRATDWRVRAWI